MYFLRVARIENILYWGNPIFFKFIKMNSFQKISYGLSKKLYWIAGAAIVAMMLITSADVVLRYFRMPIPGTYELVCFLGAVAAAFAMAHTSLEKGHVSVSFVVALFPQRIQGLIESITHLFGLFLFVLIAWQSAVYANELRLTGEVSLDSGTPLLSVCVWNRFFRRGCQPYTDNRFIQKYSEDDRKMSLTTIGIIGIISLVILLYSKMPVGFAMGFVGLIGFSCVVNFNAGLSLLSRDVWDAFSSYNLTVIPLFVFMGQIAFYAGISRRLYDSAYVLLGHRRGGLAMTPWVLVPDSLQYAAQPMQRLRPWPPLPFLK